MTVVFATLRPELARLTLPPPAYEVTGPWRSYFVYQASGPPGDDHTFIDPIDGEIILEVHTFTTSRAADLWIEVDMARQPQPMPGGVM